MVNIRTESESLAEVGRRLSLAKGCGPARLCLFLNLKIKTLFTKKTTDIGGKVGGSVTYQILRRVTGKDGWGAEAEPRRRGRGRKQLQSALKTFPTTIFYLSTYQQVPFPPHHELIQVTTSSHPRDTDP